MIGELPCTSQIESPITDVTDMDSFCWDAGEIGKCSGGSPYSRDRPPVVKVCEQGHIREGLSAQECQWKDFWSRPSTKCPDTDGSTKVYIYPVVKGN